MRGGSSWLPLALGLILAHPVGAGWLPLGGPAEPVIELQLHPSRPELLYARVVVSDGLEEAYLWRSRDGGATWRNVQSGLERPSSALAIDPTDPEVIWVWTADGQLWRSEVGGDTWSRRFVAATNAIEPDVHQLLVAGGRVYRVEYESLGARVAVSRDSGASFRQGGLLPHSSGLDSLFFHPGRNELVSFDQRGLQVSTDEGLTWKVRGRYRQKGFVGGRLAPSAPDTLYGLPSGFSPCLVRSDDAGAHWLRLAQPRLPASDSACYDVAIDPNDARHVWVAAEVVGPEARRRLLFESRDGGGTWSRPLRMPTTGVIAAGGDVLYTGGTRGLGLHVSRDGGRSWMPIHQGIAAGDLRQGFVAQRLPTGGAGRRLVALEHRSDGGKDWVKLPLQAPFAVVDAGSPIVLALDERGLFRSQDGGGTWQAVTPAPPGAYAFRSNAIDPRFVGMEAFESTGPFGSSAFWTSDGGGATWSRAGAGLTTACSHIASVDVCPFFPAYAVDPFDHRRRWTSQTYVPFFDRPPVLFISEDGGASWRPIDTELPLVLALAPDPGSRDRLLAGTERGLYVSEDGGEDWFPFGDGLPDGAAVRQLVWDARAATWYAATADRGIYRSLDDAATWTLLAGPPDHDAPAIAVDPRRPAALLAAFRGQGVWRWTP